MATVSMGQEEQGGNAGRGPRAGKVITVVLAAYLLVVVTIASLLLLAAFPQSVFAPLSVAAPGGSTVVTVDKAEPPPVAPAPSGSAATVPAVRTTPAVSVVQQAVPRWDFQAVTFREVTIVPKLGSDQGLILLAFLAGLLGSFVHAAQSLAVFVGNREFLSSWILWYVLRPFIGAVLGVLFYFVARAGLLSANADSVSPYGVVAFGALAGWFSKQATDKLAEVFETMFRTQKGPVYKDALGGTARPKIVDLSVKSISLATLTPGDLPLRIDGEGFIDGATVFIANQKVAASLSGKSLDCKIPFHLIPTKPGDIEVVVENPLAPNAPSTQRQRSEPWRIQVL